MKKNPGLIHSKDKKKSTIREEIKKIKKRSSNAEKSFERNEIFHAIGN